MKRHIAWKTLAPLTVLGAVLAVSGLAFAQYVPPPPPPPVVDQWAPPPPAFVATSEPVYYEGHAVYWYNNHWYWRDAHGRWSHYENEPQFLHEHRLHAPPPRHYYERHR